MPNWCEGNIRLRGKRADIMDFLRNEIECVGYRNYPDGLETQLVEIEEFYGDVIVNAPDNMKNTAFCRFHIKETRRNFISGKSFNVYLDEDAEPNTICIDGFRAAWGVEAEPYLKKARKYGIDIHIVGFERGMEFSQEIEIVGGELLKDCEIKYDDWMWECPMPNMGG